MMPRPPRAHVRFAPAAGLVALAVTAPVAASPSPEQLAFFESKIRPVLVQHCYSCHSAEALAGGKLKAELLLDSRPGMAKGGESGPAVVPGDKEASLILAALKHEGFDMPPAGKLPDQVIADFEKWVDMGAPDPRTEPAATLDERVIDAAAGRQHWAYRRLGPVSPPQPDEPQWCRNDIDRFVLAKQRGAGIGPAPEAAKATLARRVFFDLTGLPPTPEELEAFLTDDRPQAYESMVDRLLASPRYGERQARHWLDAVRYGESGGYEFDADRAGAHHYRDWVIRALNDDLPYDEFLRLQIAGDLIAPGDYDATAATGFLVAGPYPGQVTAKTVEPIRYDQLDDMVATIGSSVLGMTIGCARCHDHKYDPIGHRDYYAMIACLGRAVQRDADLDPDPEATKQKHASWQAERASIAAEFDRYRKDDLPARVARWLATDAGTGQAAAWFSLEPTSLKAAKATLSKQSEDVIAATGRLEGDDTYTLTFHTHQRGLAAFRLEALAQPGGGPGTGKDGAFRLSTLKVTASPLVATADRQPVTPPLVPAATTFQDAGFELAKAVDGDPATGWATSGQPGLDQAAVFTLGQPVGFEGGTLLTVELKFEANQPGLARLRLAATTEPARARLVDPAAPQAAREIAVLLDSQPAAGHDAEATSRNLLAWLARVDREVARVVNDLAAVDAREPKPVLAKVYSATNGAWVITGNAQAVKPGSQDVFVLGRGEVGRKQGRANPGFVLATVVSDDAEQALLTGTDGKPLTDSRLGLATFLTNVERGAGPLAARVIVNRLWHHHFGRGLVATPNDFGTQGQPPSHPELLEWLATRLVENRWSLKSIHRLIVTSATYRQGGGLNPKALAEDPDNTLLWQRKPVRLEGEAIRDALLAASGLLDFTMFGRTGLDVKTPRRSIYLTVKRSEPIGFLNVFDLPEPVQSVGARGVATVPTQALTMLNSPFVRSAAESLAKRATAARGGSAADAGSTAAIEYCFMAALSRQPSVAERENFRTLLAAREQAASQNPAGRQASLADVCHLIFCLNEFIYVD